MTTLRCWVLSDGKAGMESQCLGLAGALGLTPEIKRISPRAPWKFLPPQLWPWPLLAPGPGGDRLTPPWPDLLIATGRQAVAPSIAIRRAAAGATVTVQIQNPRVSPARFDVVITPEHDGLAGPNVVTTLGSLHGVTAARLDEAAAAFADRYAALPRPLVAVLIGGANRQYRMPPACADRLGAMLAEAATASGAGLIITPSRRTSAKNMRRIAAHLKDVPTDIWDGDGDNPYCAMLGLADAIVVTGDSVNMMTEA
ncbi:MAG: mitochondrial fission ELM1 family protein, partial [Alphaproteobacteria bacterium]